MTESIIEDMASILPDKFTSDFNILNSSTGYLTHAVTSGKRFHEARRQACVAPLASSRFAHRLALRIAPLRHVDFVAARAATLASVGHPSYYRSVTSYAAGKARDFCSRFISGHRIST